MKNKFVISLAAALLLSITPRMSGQTSTADLQGSWEGTLDAGQKLRLVLNVSKSNGSYSASLDSLDQGSTVPVDVITLNGDSVHVELKTVGAVFDGNLNQDRSEITGQFSQGGARLPLILKRRAQTAATPPAPATAAKPSTAQRPLDVPVDIEVPAPPIAFKGDGKTHICYELHITNFGRSDCVLTRLDIVDGSPQHTKFATFEGAALGNRILRPGVTASTTADRLKLGPGLRMVVYLWATFDSEAPQSIEHRLSFKVGDYPEELQTQSTRIPIDKRTLEITPPLRGGEWLAGNGPSNTSGHRRALVPVGGGVHIAQRYAIDFVQLREDGRTFTGDEKDNKNYRCYGAEALAVADAVVAATKDGIPQNVPGLNSRAVPITLETVGGNHVVLDLGGGRFAFYAHLQPGSLRVKVGDKVRRGQVLGLVGNSGNSTEPHLHFHISNGISPLGSEGMPYSFTSFEVQGKGWGWKASSSTAPPEKRRMQMPLENEVMRFSPDR